MASDELAQKVGTKDRPAPIDVWEQTGELPLKKLELIAAKTHAPFSMLFLDRPPEELLPIRDFRQASLPHPRKPSLNLLQSVYDCQLRQTWLSQHLQTGVEAPLDFVGSATTADLPANIGCDIRSRLRIGTDEHRTVSSVPDAVLWMINRVDESGILVQRNGVVGNHSRRPLDPDEFKDFALVDQWAPLVFINGNGWIGSQIFTIVHECAHIWIGMSGIPGGDWFGQPSDPIESWCNEVAAEVLMPADEVRENWHFADTPRSNVQRLRHYFTVSSLALLVRARTLSIIDRTTYDSAREAEEKEFKGAKPKRDSGGGDYYRTTKVSLGRRFIREVVASTLEGKTLYSEAFDLLGTKKTSVFDGLKERYLYGGGS